MKIIYLSTSKLPTNKAYGVTVLETWNAAKSLNIDLDIYSPGQKDLLNNLGIHKLHRISLPKKSNCLLQNIISRLIFNLNSLIIPILAVSKIEFRKCKFVWTRDLKSALVLTIVKRKSQFLVEIHHLPTKIDLRILKRLATFKNVKFSVISTKLHRELAQFASPDKIFVAPMAVPKSFFMSGEPKGIHKPLRMIYLGKGESSGQSNGLEILATDFAEASKSILEIEMHFIGLEPQYETLINKKMLSLGVNKSKFSFIQHISHAEVATILPHYEVGVLPYPASIYNNERFPIKSLEYAASGLVILATDIDSHTEIISETRSFLYQPGIKDSFSTAIRQILEKPDLVLGKKLLAKEWAEQHTYDMRICGIVNAWVKSDQ